MTLQQSTCGPTVREDYNIVGKFKPGVLLPLAQAEMDTVTARLRRDFPENYAPNGGLTKMADLLRGSNVTQR
jgi:hypothetical protein